MARPVVNVGLSPAPGAEELPTDRHWVDRVQYRLWNALPDVAVFVHAELRWNDRVCSADEAAIDEVRRVIDELRAEVEKENS